MHTKVPAVFAVVGLLACGGGKGDPAPPAASWSEHACSMETPDGLSTSDFLCGTLTVPVRWDAPDGPTLTIEVAVLKGGGAPDPVVFFGGGPGVWNLDGYLHAQAGSVLEPIAADRDVVFFDQRGNGRSSPALFCEEYDEAFLASLGTVTDARGDAEAFLEGYAACRARLDAEGVDLSAFHSAAVGDDVAALMELLGYDSYHLYGISYGGRQVQAMLRDHPEHVASVVLDSTTMPELSFGAVWPANFQRALEALFDDCAASATCSVDHPDLRGELVAAMDVLDADPYVSAVNVEGTSVQVQLNGDRFAQVVHGALYRSSVIPMTTNLIGALARGELGLIDAFVPSLASVGGMDRGLYAATLCAEEIPFDTEASIEAARAGLDRELTDSVHEYNGGYFLEMCDIFDVEARSDLERQPVVSDVPALVLSGNLDPATPPSNGELAAQNLANSQFLLFNGVGHGVLRTGSGSVADPSCAQQVVRSFLEDPGATVDGACAAALPGPYD